MALNFLPTPSFKAAALSDTVNESNAAQGGRPGFDCFMVGVTGAVSIFTDFSATVVLPTVPANTVINMRGVRINNTGTTATTVLVGYHLPL